MFGVNKILLVFGITVIILWIGFLRFVESDYFSSMVSNKFTNLIEEKFSSKITFKKIDVHVFPLGTTFRDVQIVNSSPTNDLNPKLNISQLSFYVNVVDFWKKRLSIKKVFLKNAKIDLDTYAKFLDKFHRDLSSIEGLEKIFKKNKSKSATYKEMKDGFSKLFPLNLKIIQGENILLNLKNRRIDLSSIELGNFSSLMSLRANVINYDIETLNSSIQDIDVGVRLSENSLILEKVRVADGINEFNAAGIIKNWQNERSSELDLIIRSSLDLNVLPTYLRENIVLNKLESGFLVTKAEARGLTRNPSIDLEASLEEIKTELLKADQIFAKGSLKNNRIDIAEVKASDLGGSAKISNPVKIWSAKEGVAFPLVLNVETENLSIGTALWSLKETLYPLRGRVTGPVEVSISRKNVTFNAKEKVHCSNLELNFSSASNKQKPIFKIAKSEVSKLAVNWNLKSSVVGIDGQLSFGESTFVAKGSINEKGLYFTTVPRRVRFKDLGPISGVELKGDADLGLEIVSNSKESELRFKGQIKEFGLLGFALGNTTSEFKFDLDDLKLIIDFYRGQLNKTIFSAYGEVDFNNRGKIDLNFDFEQATYKDSLIIYEPLVSRLDKKPDDVLGSYEAKYKLQGPFDVNEIEVNGNLNSSRLDLYSESIEHLSSELTYKNNIMELKNLKFSKGEGIFTGGYSFDRKKEVHEFKLGADSLFLNEFSFIKRLSLGFNGKLNGFLSGRGKYPDIEITGSGDITESRVNNLNVEDSKVYLSHKDKVLSLNADMMGDIGKFNINLNYSKKKPSPSNLKFAVKTKEINLLTGIFASDEESNEVKGVVDLNGDLDFSYSDFGRVSGRVDLKEFSLKRDDIDITKRGENKITIRDGLIKEWNFNIDGKKGKIISKGSGNLRKDYLIKSDGFISSSIFEVFSNKLSYSRGEVYFNSVFSQKKGAKDFETIVKSDNLNFNIETLPASFENVSFASSFDGKRINIEKCEGLWGKGKFKVGGQVGLELPFPKFNLNINIDKSNINLFDKSRFLISMQAELRGNKLPITIKGNSLVLGGLLGDELDYFSKNKLGDRRAVKYLPKVAAREKLNFFKYDIDLEVPNGVRVTNSLANFVLEGSGKLIGGENSPILFGNFRLVPGSGRLLFNNNDFILSRADIRFDDTEKNNPKFNLFGASDISEYTVNMSIRGEALDYDIDLTSTPALSREDILSLMTLGFTGEVSKNLEDQERESLSSVGIGSLLFDKFQINQGLRSSLGLRLSVSPEITDSEESLLRGRSTSEGGGATRVRTASKIKVQKRLNEEMDLSVSSTVGGSIQQRQEMNLNYRLNDNFSVQGVYELKTYEDEQEVQNPDSLGLDLKYRRSFK